MDMWRNKAGLERDEGAYDDCQTMCGTARWRRVCVSGPKRHGAREPAMTHRLGLSAWATSILVLAAVSACGGQDRAAGPSTTGLPATSAASSPSSKAASEATRAMRRYFRTLDLVRSDPSVPVARLRSAMISSELSTESHLVQTQRARGDKQVGRTRIAALIVQSTDLNNSDPQAGAVPTVTVDVCWDVSGADLVNRRGESVVTSARPDRGWTRYFVSNYRWTTHRHDGWRVADGKDLKKAPCAAA